jgi:geranylgeranyl diphosphate synthase type II
MTDPATRFKAKLQLWREAIQAELEHNQFAEEPRYLNDPLEYALRAEGKRLRPALCFAATEAFGKDWRIAMPAALALEIFHTFTLVHDDIMDQDDMRRGKPTVHQAFDVNRALIAGDAILIHAYQYINQLPPEVLSEALQMFNQAALDVCRGQAWDMQFETADQVLASQYESMVDEKTGALVRLACGMGALVAGGSREQVAHLESFGLLLGRAFQLQDDLLEMTSSMDVMGKSLGSDVVNEKKTWLWLDLLEQLSEPEAKALHTRLKGDEDLDAKVQAVRQAMKDRGTLVRASKQIHRWVDTGHQHLQTARLQDSSTLEALAQLILTRKR